MNVVSANGLSILAINANNNQNLQTVVKLKVLTNGLNDLEKMIVNMKKIKYIDHIERDNL
jgi:ethanolamine ammonia-lyase small subunit